MSVWRLVSLLAAALLPACTVGELPVVGRPCGEATPCGPGARCDEAKHTCVLAGDGPRVDRAGLDVLLEGGPDRRGDAGRGDVARRDLTRDRLAQPRDGRPREARPIDLRRPDVQVPAPDSLPPPTCTVTFGTVTGFVLCQQTATTCVFLTVRTAAGANSCTNICKNRGSTCLKAESNTASSCTGGTVVPCTQAILVGICTCSR